MADLDDRSPVKVPAPTIGAHATNKTYVDNAVASGSGGVPTTRQVATSSPLTGGGALSADLTLGISVGTTAGTVAAGNDSRIVGAQQTSERGAASGYASLDSGGKVPVAQLPPLGSNMTPTATKTAAYTAAPGELVMVDATAGPVTITLPAWALLSTIGVKKLDSSANLVTVAAAAGQSVGSSAAASLPIRLNDQAVYYQANPQLNTNWVVAFSHLPLPALDARFLGIAAAAGGSLAGNYPNPTIAAGAIGSSEVAAAIKDAAAGTASLRTLGTGAAQAAAGTHVHAPQVISLSNLTSAGANISVDASAGPSGSVWRVAATSSASTCNLAVPTNGSDAQAVNVEVLGTVATSITVNGSILLTAGITSPISVPIGKRAFLGLRYLSGIGWFLQAAAVQS